MNGLLSIGDFSRMTFLSVKTLRHYHDVGLLEPAYVDDHSGYRYYRLDQVTTAQLIRRFRSLDLPVEEVRTVLSAPDEASRNRVIVGHLERMSAQLRETQATVESLQRLLTAPTQLTVTYRDETPVTALGIVETVDASEWIPWWIAAFTELHAELRASGLTRTGPDGALFPTEAFTDERGELVAFVPIPGEAAPAVGGRVQVIQVPGARVAVTSYDGPLVDLDQAYSAVGAWVWEQARSSDGPVRERYLPTGAEDDLFAHVTEVCWPVG
ncbi:MerR family transcriptional regulator [Nocardioides sp. CER19]|uniref:MerR family transcriptional regulator n=1 Tax=Nocardioides sp. CER19 TaxID=3038538 RepID=UPI00244CE180|nr:MerR family transcriptional regulator [Nocardioides sp. CER19]MDH2412871.1 MerR family transcriptional regulator [Nocardioides sp. CER19]